MDWQSLASIETVQALGGLFAAFVLGRETATRRFIRREVREAVGEAVEPLGLALKTTAGRVERLEHELHALRAAR